MRLFHEQRHWSPMVRVEPRRSCGAVSCGYRCRAPCISSLRGFVWQMLVGRRSISESTAAPPPAGTPPGGESVSEQRRVVFTLRVIVRGAMRLHSAALYHALTRSGSPGRWQSECASSFASPHLSSAGNDNCVDSRSREAHACGRQTVGDRSHDQVSLGCTSGLRGDADAEVRGGGRRADLDQVRRRSVNVGRTLGHCAVARGGVQARRTGVARFSGCRCSLLGWVEERFDFLHAVLPDARQIAGSVRGEGGAPAFEGSHGRGVSVAVAWGWFGRGAGGPLKSVGGRDLAVGHERVGARQAGAWEFVHCRASVSACDFLGSVCGGKNSKSENGGAGAAPGHESSAVSLWPIGGDGYGEGA